MVEDSKNTPEHEPFDDHETEANFQRIVNYDGGIITSDGHTRERCDFVINEHRPFPPETDRFISELWSVFMPEKISSDTRKTYGGIPYEIEIYSTSKKNVNIAKRTYHLQQGDIHLDYIFFNSLEKF